MVGALPAAEKKKIISSRSGDNLQSVWRTILGKYFYISPLGYVDDLKRAKREGTLEVVRRILEDKKE